MSLVFSFGKHNKQPIVEVCESDPAYAQWFARSMTDRFPKECELIKTLVDMDGVYLRFGKHQGKTLSWIYANDKPYFFWLKGSEIAKNNEFIANRIKSILGNAATNHSAACL